MTALRALRDRYRVPAEPLRTERRIELAVVVLCALLLLQLSYGAIRTHTLGPPAAVAPAAGSLQLPEVVGAVSASEAEREAIEARPLFWAGRRPGAPVAGIDEEKESARSGEIEGVRVVGVFADGTTEGVIALVKERKLRILLGEELEGWTLKAVRPTEADFANGPRRETISLQRGMTAGSTTEGRTARRKLSSERMESSAHRDRATSRSTVPDRAARGGRWAGRPGRTSNRTSSRAKGWTSNPETPVKVPPIPGADAESAPGGLSLGIRGKGETNRLKPGSQSRADSGSDQQD